MSIWSRPTRREPDRHPCRLGADRTLRLAVEHSAGDLLAKPCPDIHGVGVVVVTRYGQSYNGAETFSAVSSSGVQRWRPSLTLLHRPRWGKPPTGAIGSAGRCELLHRYHLPRPRHVLSGVASLASNPALSRPLRRRTRPTRRRHRQPQRHIRGGTAFPSCCRRRATASRATTHRAPSRCSGHALDEFLTAFVTSSGGGTDLNGRIADAGSAVALPPLTGNIGLDGAQNVGGKDVDFYAVSVVAGQQLASTSTPTNRAARSTRCCGSLTRRHELATATTDTTRNQPAFAGFVPDVHGTKAETLYLGVSGYSNRNYDPPFRQRVSGSTGIYAPCPQPRRCGG